MDSSGSFSGIMIDRVIPLNQFPERFKGFRQFHLMWKDVIMTKDKHVLPQIKYRNIYYTKFDSSNYINNIYSVPTVYPDTLTLEEEQISIVFSDGLSTPAIKVKVLESYTEDGINLPQDFTIGELITYSRDDYPSSRPVGTIEPVTWETQVKLV